MLNAAEHLRPGDLFVAFADNLYLHDNPVLALSQIPAGGSAVLVRPYRPHEAAGRGSSSPASRTASSRSTT